MMAARLTARLSELVAARVPLVHATVVRAQKPTSARPGDEAIVLADGTMEGFVGGLCAQESVRVAALDALRDDEPVLLRVLPDGAGSFPESPGARVVVNPCLSGGALEIFLQPSTPPAQVCVVGVTPTAEAVASLASTLGFEVVDPLPGPPASATAVIVSTHGEREEETIRAALDAGTGFIGLVASSRRGEALLADMDLSKDERSRIRTPVGIEIGARTPLEIAVSIMAEVIRAIRLEGLTSPPAAASIPPVKAVDPICGMTVIVLAETPHLRRDGHDHWFCGDGCREHFAAGAGAANPCS